MGYVGVLVIIELLCAVCVESAASPACSASCALRPACSAPCVLCVRCWHLLVSGLVVQVVIVVYCGDIVLYVEILHTLCVLRGDVPPA